MDQFVPVIRTIIMKMKAIGVPFEIEDLGLVAKPNGLQNKPVFYDELIEDEAHATVSIIANH